ncbi:bifunctional diguanylate cyclase/phosphodiesterase [uncultured Cellulomonas sp.]|uniref:putative bifunctional diguanylate cyclase/phosphodiesterase n=1 Tax=uncultured Cellulomonas sp. TaxID=189682 RepID=UPI002632B9AC|nr:bifunctional diguanylate cyclase/phosphodiesterase [uncultured Cellulomonas sp.]
MTDAATAAGVLPAPVVGALVGLVVVTVVVAYLLGRRARREAARAADLQTRLRAAGARTDALEELAGAGTIVQAGDGRPASVSDGALRVLRLAPDDVRGRAVGDLPAVLVDDAGRRLAPGAVLGRAAAGARGPDDAAGTVVGVASPRTPDDEPRRVHVRSRTMPGGDDAVVTVLLDVTDRRGGLATDPDTLRATLAGMPVAMAVADLDGTVVTANDAFAALLGTGPAGAVGHALAGRPGPDAARWHDGVARLQAGDARFAVERWYPRPGDRPAWVVVDVALVRPGAGRPDALLVAARDLSEYRERSEAMAHRAMHDPLTGLANRALLQEVLQSALEEPGADQRVAVLACDLDGFKPINDRYGHAAGDEVLVHVAGVLRAATGGSGTVARLGGDEFVIVLHAIDGPRRVQEVAGAVHAGLRDPVRLHGHPVTVRASIGVALGSPDLLERGAPAVLAAADAALYRAKAAGRSRTEVYDPGMQVAGAPVASSTEILGAIERGELVLHLQPLVDLRDGSVVGHEAVVRWQHPERGLLLPASFAPAADAAGLGVTVTRHVLALAVAQLVRTPAPGGRPDGSAGGPDGRLAVQVPADLLADGELADAVVHDLTAAGVLPQRLLVLLSGASWADDGGRVRRAVEALRAAGVPVVLDGFGAGASLAALRDLPLDGVRLDVSFTAGLTDDPAAARVARAVGALAQELGLATIAPGVQTQEQAAVLRDGGWRYGQGWLFGAAQPASAPS